MNQFHNEPVAFYELQRFEQQTIKWLVIIAALFPFILFAAGYYLQVMENKPFGSNPLSNDGLITAMFLSLIFGSGILTLFFKSKLETYVTTSGLHIRLFPFMKFKTYKFEDIKKFKIRQYRPLIEYGGWGIRIGPSGRAFNIHGKTGLQIVLNKGNKVLIGTQQPDMLLAAVSQYVKTNQE